MNQLQKANSTEAVRRALNQAAVQQGLTGDNEHKEEIVLSAVSEFLGQEVAIVLEPQVEDVTDDENANEEEVVE